jgi:hypothetical protein
MQCTFIGSPPSPSKAKEELFSNLVAALFKGCFFVDADFLTSVVLSLFTRGCLDLVVAAVLFVAARVVLAGPDPGSGVGALLVVRVEARTAAVFLVFDAMVVRSRCQFHSNQAVDRRAAEVAR